MRFKQIFAGHGSSLSFLRFVIRGHKSRLTGLIAVGLGSVTSSLLFVWLSKSIVDIATGEREGSWEVFALALLLAMVAQSGLRVIGLYLRNRTAVRMGNSVRLRLFSHLLYTRWQSLRQVHSGDMLTRMIRDTDDVINFFVEIVPSIILSMTLLLGALIMLYIYSPALALILGLGTPIAILLARLYYRRMLRYSHEVKQAESRITSRMQEALTHQTIIRTFERQDEEIGHLDSIQGELFGAVNRRLRISMISNMMITASFGGGYLAAFLWSTHGLMQGTITFGMMTSFLQLVSRVQRPLSDLIGVFSKLINTRTSVHRLVSVLEYQTETKGRLRALTGRVHLVVEGVSFRYEADNPWVLRDLSLSAEPGEMLALMGRTGAGKTTLIRLLLGLVVPEMGNIYLEHEGHRYRLSESTRSNFVYVPQEPSLFSGSVRDNLLVGNPQATEQELVEALHTAVAEFAHDLPQGLDTMLSEDGGGLSQGQRQRLAIARSLLRAGNILLLDEVTSALDAETEQELMHRLRAQLRERIVLFITHTQSVAEHCDRIISL